ncbi:MULTISPECIES: DUF1292 domain-containing protein [Bacillaceae]|uniref:DUF1292 domain-containing protein n=1 Tax=Evansella alkalicola TaxID=745819 RepID=A0ABS6JTW8_9BACI|nr:MULTISPECIES: DUF1292 domain-containing protein [Bacillaceae]MBU9720585.1 DUF1292 domain-containing protein [Bacillus alkalicola]
MSEQELITIKDEEGNEKVFQVDAMFDMGDYTYAMITSGDETLIMRVEEDNGEQSLISATEEEIENLLAAYNIALNADYDEDPLIH